MDTACSNAPACKAHCQIAHKGGRSAEVEVGVAWDLQLLEHAQIQTSRCIEIQTCLILETGRAVANAAVGMHQGFKQGARLLGKRMLTAVVGSVQPPDFSGRCVSCQ